MTTDTDTFAPADPQSVRTEIPEANPIRGLSLTSIAPPVVERLITREEAKECALRLANAAVSNGPRPVIHRPARPTDDDVTVLAFIAQRGDPIALQEPASTDRHPAIDELGLLFAGQFGMFTEAKPTSLTAAAVSLLNPGAKPKTPLPSPLTIPVGDRHRLLLAASLILHEVAMIDVAAAVDSPPLITTT